MICPNCQGKIPDKRIRCDRCGHDLSLYKKIYRASNMYYNNGLARAKVRDLSGAIIALKNSLELNKSNANARNLLGLVYFEMGETVAALSEWVISKHFKPEDNDADDYINAIQDNPTKLDGLNQAIKRYNNALTFAKQGSDDLAIIQLKRVIQLNPNFIRAYHLLSLLYMKNEDNEKAKKCLLRAARIDVSGTTTLRYLKELTPKANLGREQVSDLGNKDVSSTIMPVSSYREDKPNVMAFVNLVIGVLIGIAVMAILGIPSVEKNKNSDNNQTHIDYSAGLASLEEKEAAIARLQEEKSELETKVASLESDLASIVIPEDKPELYDGLFEAFSLYLDELAKDEGEREYEQIAEKLRLLDTSEFESDASLQLIEMLRQEIYPVISVKLYDKGHDIYSKYRYDEALEIFLLSNSYDPTNVNTIYFIGRSYHRLEDYDNARLYYEKVVEEFPGTKRHDSAKTYLNRLPD